MYTSYISDFICYRIKTEAYNIVTGFIFCNGKLYKLFFISPEQVSPASSDSDPGSNSRRVISE